MRPSELVYLFLNARLMYSLYLHFNQPKLGVILIHHSSLHLRRSVLILMKQHLAVLQHYIMDPNHLGLHRALQRFARMLMDPPLLPVDSARCRSDWFLLF